MAGDVDQVHDLLREIGYLLTGRPPEVQGAVLADLLATWLAGHVDRKSHGRTKQTRKLLLEMHLEAVRKLVPENALAMGLPW
jgi:hypothetical protein